MSRVLIALAMIALLPWSALGYSSSVVPPKDWWIHDAVLDGNNLWTRYEMVNGKGSADFVSWRDAELARLMKKE